MLLPRLSNNKNDARGPRYFIATWDETMSLLEGLANSFGGSGSSIPELTGNGRLASVLGSATDSDQFLTSSPSLNIVLPVGFEWVQDGVLHSVEDEKLLTGLPAGFEGFVSLDVITDSETGEDVWTLATSSTRPAPGSGVLAYVETDADGVTLLDATESKSDLVLSVPLLMARFRAIEALGGSGSGSGSGGTIGDTLALNQLKEALASLTNRVLELEGASGDGVVAAQTNYERLDAEQMGQSFDLIAVNPLHAQTTPMSVLWDGVTGNGENLSPSGNQPDVHAGGNEPLGG